LLAPDHHKIQVRDMVDISTATLVTRPARPNLDGGTHPSMAIAFLVLLVGGIIFTGYHLYADIQSAHVQTTTWIPFLFLALALFIALGFEFVNGFHDTANAVATVIYTHSLPPVAAVIWSGCWNFLSPSSWRMARVFGQLASGPQ
jgi:PiT family inorganic phosphate transporter